MDFKLRTEMCNRVRLIGGPAGGKKVTPPACYPCVACGGLLYIKSRTTVRSYCYLPRPDLRVAEFVGSDGAEV